MGKLTEMMSKYQNKNEIKVKNQTPEEIRAKYRPNGDASSAAAQARDKLVERGEKLEKLSLHSEELKNGAQNYASLANDLAKEMENRNKWWKL